jgi:isoquinoline 1-oxidoreductase subunit alpha
MASYTLRVNGKAHRVEADADTPVLWVLRDRLELTGTKYGCGQGICGACTVQVAGRPERSCTVTVADVAGREVATIEGLGAKGLHPLQRAWIEEDVAQCGYCQPGILLEVAALLGRRPRPSDAEVEEALAGHVCRCGTYDRIRRAVRRAAASVGTGR